MKVYELIEFLKTKDQDLDIAYGKYSDQCLLEVADISEECLGEARSDGWVAGKRPDKPSKGYLIFPGN